MESIYTRIYENIKVLAKINNQKMSDVEKQICVSPGYLSRERGLKIDRVYALSKIFGVTINDLIEKDYKKEYKEKLALMEFKCPSCGEPLSWDSDASAEDVGYSTEGIVSYYHCRNCNVEVEVFSPLKGNNVKDSE